MPHATHTAVAVALALSSVVARASAQAPTFPSPVLPLGSNFISNGVTIHDVNGDGNADVLAVSSQGLVVVYLGNGAGGFSSPTNFAANSSPVAIAAGDLDGDTIPDVVVTNFNPNYISVLKGLGSGLFAGPVTYATATSPNSIVLSDMNGDTLLDAVVAAKNSNSVSVLLGNGVGGFGAATNFTVGTAPVVVVVADFNNDGKKDFATCNQSSNNVSVRLGDGLGGFGAVTNFAVGNFKTAASVAVGDFNLDGKADLVASHASASALGATVFIGDGLGGFAAGFDINMGANASARSVVVADFNSDGKPDIATANNQSKEIAIRFGNGLGTFPTIGSTPAPNKPSFLCLGDVNNDGKPDVATIGDMPEVEVLRGDGVGGFIASKVFANGTNTWSPVLCDYNHNGKLDVLASAYLANATFALSGDGAGNFGTQTLNPSGGTPRGLAVCDFNGDGKIDYAGAASSSNAVVVSLGNGTSTFGAGTSYTVGAHPWSAHTGDFNSDGKIDLVTPNLNGKNVSFLAGNGAGGFAAAVNTTFTPDPQCGAVGDFDLDGNLDFFVGGTNVKIAVVLMGNGLGAFPTSAATTLTTNNETQNAVSAGDLNFDGAPDIALAISSAATPTLSVRILYSIGAGNFSQFATISTFANNPAATSVLVGDADGDGREDLFTANQYRVSYYTRDTLGGFVASGTYSAGLFPILGALGDLDSDGRPELVVGSSAGAGGITVLKNLVPPSTGVSRYGTGTYGCSGILGMGTNSVPASGNSNFAITTTNAPLRSLGVCIIANAQDAAGTDLFSMNFLVHLNLLTATEVLTADSFSDDVGSAFAPAPIPVAPAIVGSSYFAQTLFVEPPHYLCSPGQFGLVSANGLTMVIQP